MKKILSIDVVYHDNINDNNNMSIPLPFGQDEYNM